MSESVKPTFDDLVPAHVGKQVSRRQFIRGGLALGLSVGSMSTVLAACTPSATPTAARTATPTPAPDLSVLAWGGSYGDALRKFISDPFAQAHGNKVLVQDQAVAEQSAAKLKAEIGQPTIDVWLTTSTLPSDLAKLGGLWELTPDKIPNLANIVPATNQMYQGKIYGAGIHLNTKTITVDSTRIRSLIPDYDISMLNDWDFIWRPELFNQISVNSFQSNFGLLNLAMTIHRGGSQQNEDAWFKALRELAPNVHTEIGAAGGIGQLQLFQSKEVMVAANNMTDAQQLVKNGIQVDIGYPQNPLVPILDYVVAIKNGPAGQDLAFDYINRMLDAKTMPDYDAAIGNYHTNSKAAQPTLTSLPPLSPEVLLKASSFDLELAVTRFEAVFARYQKEIVPLFGKRP